MKRLILCCDGTWNEPDQETNGKPAVTNVVKLARRVAKTDGSVPQITYYDQGVGTTGNCLERCLDGATGAGLDENIYQAYLFLMTNYELGDEIFLFGFSRGAFTVRSLGGMIRKCGILRRGAADKYHEAKEFYRTKIEPNDPIAKEFRLKYSISPDDKIKIKFIGVWDTVGSLGIPANGKLAEKYQFHDTELSGIVENAYQALAVNERRKPFSPTLWDYIRKDNQKVEQVWFCGVHKDVGGGFTDEGLSNIALLWMLNKAQEAGLKMDVEAMDTFPIETNPLGILGKLGFFKTLIYMFISADREIGLIKLDNKYTDQLDPTQSLHESVRRRWDADPNYRPPQLRKYFKRINDPRGEIP